MKMKKISTLLIVKGILLISFIHAGSISPTLGLRFNDIAGPTEGLGTPTQCIGLKLGVGEGVYSGIETDGVDFRLYVTQSFGTFSMGIADDGVDAVDDGTFPQFAIGGHYNIVDHFNVSLDYMINRLSDADGAGGGTDPHPDQLRLSLNIAF